MFSICWFDTRNFLARFRDDTGAMIAPVVALSMIPVMTAVGAAIDYSRANNVRSKLQMALDAGLLAGARTGDSSWNQIAIDNFEANFKATVVAGLTVTKTFVQETGQLYHGNASASVPTAFLGLIQLPFLSVAVKATATASEPDNSCILTLDKGQPLSHVALKL